MFINRTAGTRFARFFVEDGQEPWPVKDGTTVGVDVGLGIMETCSDGTVVANPKALATSPKRLRRLDKTMARRRNTHGKSAHCPATEIGSLGAVADTVGIGCRDIEGAPRRRS